MELSSETVTTVTGDVPLNDLGITLTHEHLHMNFDVCYVKKPSSVVSWPSNSETSKHSFELKNLGIVRQFPYSVPYNLKLDDEDTKAIMENELLRFKELGGRTIVENTVHGISRNAELLKELSLKTGVNIVCGTGYYIAAAQPPSLLTVGIETVHDQMLKELEYGCDKDGTKCGFIGEIGCSWPLHDFEKNVIRASALLQQSTKKPISFHSARHWKSPFEIMRIFLEAGGSPDGVVMSHLDRTLLDEDKLLEFAKLEAYNQLDLFGTECSFYQFNEDIDMVSDARRIQMIRLLIENGHLERILMSHDIHTKHRLVNFGGHGYGHILQNVVPKMRTRGFTEHELQTLLTGNPRNWLRGASA